ncbi:hypothetical protein FHX15_002047 [Rhizobium sp. BK650]|uniref:hypothetical protein n=1 Tax=Rhizobium sp. BK650 TaxID=2586990 RepID=UPI00161CA687|nr:hypothetical protein [Rhizobium sp. BK650]MBB3656819.1 hypothetical protein [Rhizobium sp. BK650]
MRMKIVAASLLALGMATSAFAQSNPAPTGATMDKNTVDTGGGAGTTAKKPMTTHKVKPHNMKVSSHTKTHKLRCPGHASSSGTGPGKLQTQGGTSNATPMDEACAAHNN